jgi:hypothetical protein
MDHGGSAQPFIAALAVAIAWLEPLSTGRAVLWISVVMLDVMSVVSLATGARVNLIAPALPGHLHRGVNC